MGKDVVRGKVSGEARHQWLKGLSVLSAGEGTAWVGDVEEGSGVFRMEESGLRGSLCRVELVGREGEVGHHFVVGSRTVGGVEGLVGRLSKSWGGELLVQPVLASEVEKKEGREYRVCKTLDEVVLFHVWTGFGEWSEERGGLLVSQAGEEESPVGKESVVSWEADEGAHGWEGRGGLSQGRCYWLT